MAATSDAMRRGATYNSATRAAGDSDDRWLEGRPRVLEGQCFDLRRTARRRPNVRIPFVAPLQRDGIWIAERFGMLEPTLFMPPALALADPLRNRADR
jgi:hypothetical protein